MCGRYEGVDSRVIRKYNMREISIGDYVLSGGEIACMAFLESGGKVGATFGSYGWLSFRGHEAGTL